MLTGLTSQFVVQMLWQPQCDLMQACHLFEFIYGQFHFLFAAYCFWVCFGARGCTRCTHKELHLRRFMSRDADHGQEQNFGLSINTAVHVFLESDHFHLSDLHAFCVSHFACSFIVASV